MRIEQAQAIASCISSYRREGQSPRPGHVLVLRTCGARGEAHGNFRWPLEVGAEVSAPDWRATAECGHGLHGLLWGEGEPTSAWHWESDAAWLVVEVANDSIVEVGRKVKFPTCRIVHVGDRVSATAFIAEHGPGGKAIVGGTATAGVGGTATAGVGGTIVITFWDSVAERYRKAFGEVGENGIIENKPYVVVDGKLVRKDRK